MNILNCLNNDLVSMIYDILHRSNTAETIRQYNNLFKPTTNPEGGCQSYRTGIALNCRSMTGNFYDQIKRMDKRPQGRGYYVPPNYCYSMVQRRKPRRK